MQRGIAIGGAVREDRDFVFLNYASASSMIGGFRFQDVAVPKGATIISAKLQVYRYGSTDVDTVLRGEDADNSGVLEGGTLLDDRIQTTANVAWAGSLSVGEFTDSPDIKDIIQEIVNRDGWASGNALTILAVDGQAVKNADAYDYQDTPAKAAKLYIEYSAGPKGTQAWIGKWA